MKILITAPYHENGQKVLEQAFGEVVYRPWKDQGRAYTEKELIQLLQATQADALITEHDEVTSQVIRSFPNLQFIGVCRGTPSNVAVEEASVAGIAVFHTPARNAQAVAEMFVSNVICFLRHTIPSMEWLKAGHWNNGAHASYLQFKGNEMAGKTIGMVGFGAVGQRIAEMVRCFPCNVVFYDPFVSRFDRSFEKVSLQQVFSTSDLVSIHLPVNADTMGMIDYSLISLMKRDAIFINTARAAVVNRNDLLKALKEKKIRGAILDVYDSEPPDAVDNELIHLPSVFATPHTAGATYEVEDHHVTIMNDALLNWKNTNLPSALIVNNEALVAKH